MYNELVDANIYLCYTKVSLLYRHNSIFSYIHRTVSGHRVMLVLSLPMYSKIVYSDLEALTPEQYMKVITRKLTDIKAVESPEQRGIFIQVLENAYRFTLGSLAGGELMIYVGRCTIVRGSHESHPISDQESLQVQYGSFSLLG